jgi:hypothetical protein
MLLEMSLFMEIAWDSFNWKIWFEEAKGALCGVVRKPSCVFPVRRRGAAL